VLQAHKAASQECYQYSAGICCCVGKERQ